MTIHFYFKYELFRDWIVKILNSNLLILYIIHIIMLHEKEKKQDHCAAHACIKIAKLALKAAGVAAAFCMVHEIHKVHKSIEAHNKKHLL